jgi:LPXTG-motif cell wall-anchored protein
VVGCLVTGANATVLGAAGAALLAAGLALFLVARRRRDSFTA